MATCKIIGLKVPQNEYIQKMPGGWGAIVTTASVPNGSWFRGRNTRRRGANFGIGPEFAAPQRLQYTAMSTIVHCVFPGCVAHGL